MKILEKKPSIINVGLRSFYDSLCAQGADAIHVEWRPPAGGDLELVRLLADIDRPEIDSANLRAVEKILVADDGRRFQIRQRAHIHALG